MNGCILLAFLLTFAVQGSAQEAAPAERKFGAAEAKRLVTAVFAGDAKRAAAARKTLETTRPEDRKLIIDAIRALPFTPPKDQVIPADRTIRGSLDIPESETWKATFIVSLPKEYGAKKPLPVLFRFHGSGDTAREFDESWVKPTQPFICITPEIPSNDRDSWFQPGAHQFVDRLFRYAIQNFNVDLERVYLSGHSAGGAASFTYSQLWPHRVAGFYASAWLEWSYRFMPEPCMDSLRDVPGYFIVGLDDTDDCLQRFRRAEAYYEKKALPGEFNFVENRGHRSMPEYHQAACDFMSKSARVATPKEIQGLFFVHSDMRNVEGIINRRWWLEAKPGGYSHAGSTFYARVNGNTIDIETPELRSGTIYLSDSLVDLDQPVVVKLNGKEVHNGAVERSVPFLLDWFSRERDRGQLYWNQITF